MRKPKLLFLHFFLLFSTSAFAQLDSIAFLFKTNPFAPTSGQLKFGIEHRIKPFVSLEANWGIIGFYNNVTIIGNDFIINKPETFVQKVNGINASIFFKKYLNKKQWLLGAYMGGGIGFLNDKIYYQTNGGITGVPTEHFVNAKNIGLRYKMGYQSRWIANSYFDFSLATGVNLQENNTVSQLLNNRYKKGLAGEVQIRLITAIHAKDTQINHNKNPVRGSISINPAAFFRRGFYLGGTKELLPKFGTYGTLDAYFYNQENDNGFEIDSKNNKIYGFLIGTRNYMNKSCNGGYAGIFAGYNHMEIAITNFVSLGPPTFRTVREQSTIIKDQFAIGLQYGYTIISTSNAFIDLGLQNGLRTGNKPFVDSNNLSFNFPNGTYTKFILRIGILVH